jgi:transmembrane sensor
MSKEKTPQPNKKPRSLFWDWYLLVNRKGDPESRQAGEIPLPDVHFAQPAPADLSTREQEFEQIRQRIHQPDIPIQGQKPAKRNSYAWKPLSMAATLVLLLTASVVFWRVTRTEKIEIATPYGKTAELLLPDSSVVFLNSNSRLSYEADWNGRQNREVWLEGEGYFQVRKKQQQGQNVKFTVHTRHLDVKVIGTEFNVRQRGEKTHVVLQSGKVQLQVAGTEQSSVQMNPGELIEYESQKKTITRRQVDPLAYVSWKSRQLVLENQTLQEVATLVEQTYGLPIVFADSTLPGLRLSGKIRSDNVDLVLEAITASHNLTYVRKKDHVLITKQNTQ